MRKPYCHYFFPHCKDMTSICLKAIDEFESNAHCEDAGSWLQRRSRPWPYHVLRQRGSALTHLHTFALYELKHFLDIWVWKQDHPASQLHDISFNLPFIVLTGFVSLVKNLHNNLPQFLVSYYHRGQTKSRLLLQSLAKISELYQDDWNVYIYDSPALCKQLL